MAVNMQVGTTSADVRVVSAARAVEQLAAIMEEYRQRMERVAAARARAALVLYQQGFTYEELCLVFGVSRTVVARLLARAREDERTMSPAELSLVQGISSAALAMEEDTQTVRSAS